MPKRGQVLINVQDIVGKHLGKLEVISYEGSYFDMTNGGIRVRHEYKIKCECGTIRLMQRTRLANGTVYSCGCLRGRKKKNKIE